MYPCERMRFIMEFTNENLLNLQIEGVSKERTSKKFFKIVKQHKWISMVIISLIILSSINVIMIYNFFRILQNMSV